jgi:hypothetical protein
VDPATCNPLRAFLPFEVRKANYVHLFLRYEVGEQYKPHTDYFKNPTVAGARGNRIATVLTYLGTPDGGGETFFPTIGVEVKAVKVCLNQPNVLSLSREMQCFSGAKPQISWKTLPLYTLVTQ